MTTGWITEGWYGESSSSPQPHTTSWPIVYVCAGEMKKAQVFTYGQGQYGVDVDCPITNYRWSMHKKKTRLAHLLPVRKQVSGDIYLFIYLFIGTTLHNILPSLVNVLLRGSDLLRRFFFFPLLSSFFFTFFFPFKIFLTL